LLALADLALEDPPEMRLIPDQVGRQDAQEVRLALRPFGTPKQRAEQREVPEDRDLLARGRVLVAHEPADDDRLLILDDDGGVRLTLGDGHRAERADRRAGSAALLLDLEPNLVRLVDVRRDLDLVADVRTRRAEAAAEAEPQETERVRLLAAAEPGERAGRRAADVRLHRDFVADVDLGRDVVRREHVRGREDVRLSAARERVHADAEGGDAEARAAQVARALEVRPTNSRREALKQARIGGKRHRARSAPS